MNDEEIELDNLYELCGGVIDASDNCITFNNGKSWRDARSYELDALYKMLNRDTLPEEPAPVIQVPESIDWELGYGGDRVHYAREDVYTAGVGIGFTL